MKNNKIIQIGIGLLISGVALYYTFSGIEWKVFATEIKEINLYYYSVGCFLAIFAIYIRAIRWKYLLKPLGNFKVIHLFKGTVVGFFGNYILPVRMGEVLRPYITGKFTNYSGTKLFPTIVAERFIDMIAFFVFILLVSIFIPFGEQLNFLRIIIPIFILFLFIAGLLYYKYKEKIQSHFDSKDSIVHKFLSKLNVGFSSLFKIDNPLTIFILSLLIWLCYGLLFYFGLMAFSVESAMTVASFLLVTTTFAITIPAAPGNIGTYHYAVIFTLAMFGIEKSVSSPISVMLHLVGLIPVTILGIIFYLESHIKIRDIKDNNNFTQSSQRKEEQFTTKNTKKERIIHHKEHKEHKERTQRVF
ncbi:MAG: lysylphosphatidylglycerol synthase transmembrane domain-containing protein [Candidatus Marinimicrobia bacterium]|nr:lysylphosphatidylglycerol synthase transmembrane domain-containing protein [Candidatus Neomarinimicrobiota bacterium]